MYLKFCKCRNISQDQDQDSLLVKRRNDNHSPASFGNSPMATESKNATYDQDFHSLHTGTCICIRNEIKINAPRTLKIGNRLVQLSKIHQAQKR